MGRVGFQLPAQPGDVEPQVVGLVPVFGAPYLAEQLARWDELARIAEQDLQDTPFGRGQPDRFVRRGAGALCGCDRVGGQVDRVVPSVNVAVSVPPAERRSADRTRASSSSM